LKRYEHRPAHPDVVAGLNDAAALRGLSDSIMDVIEKLSTHPARQSLMDSNAVIIAAIKELTP
jgi:hypothetical protein